LPPLDTAPNPQGSFAVHRSSYMIAGRRAAAQDVLLPGEQRHQAHECDGTRRADQRDTWRQAAADLHRQQRNRRSRRPDHTQAAVEQPGMFRIGDPQ
jgi:hypothetical protein